MTAGRIARLLSQIETASQFVTMDEQHISVRPSNFVILTLERGQVPQVPRAGFASSPGAIPCSTVTGVGQ